MGLCLQADIDAALVRCAWDRLLPGLLSGYDSPASLPCVAPRALLVVNGAADPRCPIGGLHSVFLACKRAYAAYGCREHFEVFLDPSAAHEITDAMDCAVEDFFQRHLRPTSPRGMSGVARYADLAPPCDAGPWLQPRQSRVLLGRRSCVVRSVADQEDLSRRLPSHRRFESCASEELPC